jgi:hypothetical protein
MNRRKFLITAGLGLAGGASVALVGNAYLERRRTLTVLVSDGCRVARTDAEGRYRLEVGRDSGPFVFVTTPRGYWTDAFYTPVAKAVETGGADFTLEPMPQPERFDFVFMTDMHVDHPGSPVAKLKASIREISALKPRPALLWAQGDICLQGGSGPRYLECLKLAKMPVHNGAGNHEMMTKHKDPRDDFHRLFGPTYYSFDFGPLHCIVLDGNKPLPGVQGWKGVVGAVEASELAWLRADLDAQPKGKPIIVGVHIPIVTTYPERRRQSPENAPYWIVSNGKVLTDLFARHGVRVVLQGHMHENERATVGGVEYVASISICGSWWKADKGMERGVDNAPRGYRIVSVDGPKVTHRYYSSCESHVDRQGEFYGLDKPIKPSPKTELIFNCYDAPNGSTARCRIDGGPWQPMPAYAAPSPATEGLTMPHHFRLVTDTTRLAPGRHAIEAEAVWPDGTAVIEKSGFVVAGKRGTERGKHGRRTESETRASPR